MKLVGAHALLGRAKQIEGQQPLVERDMAGLEDRPDCDRELLAAGRTLPKATFGFAFEPIRHSIMLAAVRADGTIWPTDALQKLCGCFWVGKVRRKVG